MIAFTASLLIVVAAFQASHGCFVVNINANGGTISPVTSGGRYQSNVDCTYTITQFAPAGLIFDFTKMDLEVDDSWKPCTSDMYTCTKECDENDWVAIQEGSAEIVRRCDQNEPDYLYRSSGAATVWFHTDNNVQRSGFTLSFTVDPDTQPCTTTSTLSGKASGTIVNYKRSQDGKYRSNEDCKWKVSVPANYNAIKFTFKKVDIEGTCSSSTTLCSCSKDWVTIHDGDNDGADLITQRCGFNTPTTAFYTSTSTSPVAFIRFKTDSAVQYTGFEIYYEGCVAPCETTSTSTTTTTTTQKPLIPLPRDDVNLGYYPLDHTNKFEDVSHNRKDCDGQCHGIISDSQGGPFGDMATSQHTNGLSQPIMTVSNALTGARSFTVAFFVRIPSGETGGILSFLNAGGHQVFAADAALTSDGKKRPQLVIRGGAGTRAVDTYGPYDVLQPDVWTFVAVTFDATTCTMSLYGQYGQLYMGSYKQQLCNNAGTATTFRLGVTSSDGESSYLSSEAAVSCVSLYSEDLSYSDIAQIHEACRVTHGTAPCGSPRIPLSVIPSTTSGIPSYGQFPYIASVRWSTGALNHICSATILNRFYLLTAATCFSESKEPADFVVYVGDHNLNLTEPYEQKIAVGKIIVSKSFNISYDNIALIELAAPIELANFYVNTACLIEPSDMLGSSGYVFGWGSNGRPAQSSSTLPRFVAGSTTSSSSCSSAWGSSYLDDSNVCFQSQDDDRKNVPCSGDEGSPLLIPANTINAKNSRLLPIAVYGARVRGDCTADAPALFSDLTQYNIKHRIACNLPGYFYPDNCPVNYA